MNWYIDNIIKTAAPEGKIKRFGVQSPFVKSFIYNYEDLIDWNKIKTEADIQGYIAQKLLPTLYEKINPESKSNHYLKDIDIEREYNAHWNNPQIQQAYDMYLQDPEGAKAKILKLVNDNKQKVFYSWWKYLTQENDIYKDNPAFIYLSFKPIVDSSDSTKRDCPFALNAAAIAKIWSQVKNGKLIRFNFLKEYSKASTKIDLQKSNLENVPEGWLYIPGYEANPETFEENVTKLIRLSSGTGWCTGEGMAEPYLQQGDFHLLVVNSKPVVAIRTIGSVNVAEIKGLYNTSPVAYWQQIQEYMDAKNLDYNNTNDYDNLRAYKELNDMIGSGDLEKVKIVKQKLYYQPETYDAIIKENKQKYPELKEVATNGAKDQMKISLELIESDFSYGKKRQLINDLFSQFSNLNPEIIQEIKKDESLYSKLINLTKSRIRKNIYDWGHIPPQLQKDIGIDFAANVAADCIYNYNNESGIICQFEYLPQSIKNVLLSDPYKEIIKQKVNRLISNYLSEEDNSGKFLSQQWDDLGELSIFVSDENRQKYAEQLYKRLLVERYNTIGQYPEIPPGLAFYFDQEKLYQVWKRMIDMLPGQIDMLPDDIKKKFSNEYLAQVWWTGYVKKYPSYYWSVPEAIRPYLPQKELQENMIEYFKSQPLLYYMLFDENKRAWYLKNIPISILKETINKNIFADPFGMYNYREQYQNIFSSIPEIKDIFSDSNFTKAFDVWFDKELDKELDKQKKSITGRICSQFVAIPEQFRSRLSSQTINKYKKYLDRLLEVTPLFWDKMDILSRQLTSQETKSQIFQYYDNFVEHNLPDPVYIPVEFREKLFEKHKNEILKSKLMLLERKIHNWFMFSPFLQEELFKHYPTKIVQLFDAYIEKEPYVIEGIPQVIYDQIPQETKNKVNEYYSKYMPHRKLTLKETFACQSNWYKLSQISDKLNYPFRLQLEDFTFIPNDTPFKSTVTIIDVNKFDREWKHSPFYISSKEIIQDPYYFERFVDPKNRIVIMPVAGIDSEGQVDLYDGRHRFATLRELGIKKIPMVIPAEISNEIIERFGA